MNQQNGEWVNLNIDDGSTMRAYGVRAPGTASRAILVFQEAFGVNHHIRDICHRFAAEGWDALAPDLFHRTAPGFDGPYNDMKTAMLHLQQLTDAGLSADIRAAHGHLHAVRKVPKIEAIGFCMGGRVSILASMTVPIHGAVSFYGGRVAPSLLPRMAEVACPLLMFWGGRDQHIPLEQTRAVTDALRAAGKDFINVEISYADHAFFCDERPNYNPVAAAEAWPLTLAFLRRD